MDSMCNKKRYGGTSLVDITQHQYALHHIYVQRLIKPRIDYIVIPILRQYPQIHTGQMSALAIMMFPKKYRRMLRHIPTLSHLCHLLMKLPSLRPHKLWSAEWVMDLPLCTLLAPTDDQKRNIKHSNPIPHVRCSKWRRSNQLLLPRHL
jgi:hypothetical protein